MRIRRAITAAVGVLMLCASVVHAASDLSTPVAALRSYATAIQSQSVDEAMACVLTTGKREGRVMKSMLTMMVANEHLSKIAAAKLGQPTDPRSKALAALSSDYKAMDAKLRKAKVDINGREASVTMPAEKTSAHHHSPILWFKKVGSDWKLDAVKLFHLDQVGKMPAKQLAQRLKMSHQLVMAFNAAADDVSSGKVTTWDALRKDIMAKMMAAMGIGAGTGASGSPQSPSPK